MIVYIKHSSSDAHLNNIFSLTPFDGDSTKAWVNIILWDDIIVIQSSGMPSTSTSIKLNTAQKREEVIAFKKQISDMKEKLVKDFVKDNPH